MAAVAPQPTPAGDDQVLAGILAAQADLDGAVAKAGMNGDPIRYLLAASSAGLGAFASGIKAMRRPMDAELRAELRTEILAIYERQARQESASRLNITRMANPHAWRNAVLVGAAVGLAVLLGGLGAYRLGFSQGSAAAINEVCIGGAIKDQDGGRSCAFWLVPPNQPGQRKG